MLPGKTYTPDDYLRMAWRRRWLIVIPLIAIGASTAVVAAFLPNQYRASTSILIIPQRVPEDFVQSTVTAQLGERLNVITQQILSRTRLERIIQEFNLYERERQRLIMEDVVEGMRRDIAVSIDSPSRRRGDPTSFRISFESQEARTAMRVTERLASLFVQENLEDRSLMADQTNQFLQGQMEEAKRRLVEQEKRLQEFRQRNNGQLPDQVQSNLSLLQSTQTQLQGVIEGGNRDRDRLQLLEKNLAELLQAGPASVPAPAPISGPDGVPVGTAAQQLENARASLRILELRLKPDHPDMGRAKRLIAELEAKAEAEVLQQPLSTQSPAAPVIPVDRNMMARIEALRREMQEVQQRLESGRREAARLQLAITSHTSRVQAAPALESQMSELMRDYATVQQSYTSLLRKSEESQMAVNLERRQIGEQFRIIDGARLPERPVSPDRVRINLMGILGGLAFGLGLVALLEYKDTSLKNDDDVVTTLSLPVLAVIPLMTNATERRASRRKKLLLAASASVFCMVVAAAVMMVWRLRLVEAWLR